MKTAESWLHQSGEKLAVFSSNKWILLTQKFILALIGLIIVVDLYLAFNQIEGNTISEVIKEWAYRRFFVLSWVWGVLAGHLFLTSGSPLLSQPVSILVLLGLTLGLFAAGWLAKGVVGVPLQLGLLVLGTLAGYLL
ncbi:MAG: hypothetical protein AAF766_09755, partial [Cyanobacteria bacterium P01_D01_bin.14]